MGTRSGSFIRLSLSFCSFLPTLFISSSMAFFYLFINTPMKYALIVTAFTGLGSEIAKELAVDAAKKSIEDELEPY